jgi:hypothetical protein
LVLHSKVATTTSSNYETMELVDEGPQGSIYIIGSGP